MSVAGFDATSPAVFETGADPVVVGPREIEALVRTAREAPSGRARLLLHPDRADSLHEMVIALPPWSCDHPHINFRSGKSFLALSGRFALMRFSDAGEPLGPIVLSAGPWPGARMARLRRPTWHTIVPLEGDTVFLETIAGPFTGNRFASWFPDASETLRRQQAAERLRLAARDAAAACDGQPSEP